MPTTTTTPPNSDGPALDVTGVNPGGTGATIGGEPVEVDVTEDDGSLVVSIDDLTLRYTIETSTGQQRRLTQGTAVTLSSGDRVRVKATGFKPTSTMTAWLVPGDLPLAEAALGTDGSGLLDGVVPSGTQSGDFRVVVSAESSQGEPVVVAYGVAVQGEKSSGASWSAVLIGIMGLAIVSGLFIPAARRRRDDEEEVLA